MGMGNILVLCQVTAFLISFIVSFFIFIPISINLREFDGHCLLGATGIWDVNNATAWEPKLTSITWGAGSDCGFTVFVGVIVMLLSVFYIVWESVYLFKDTDSSWFDAFVTSIICLTICLMLFASCLILSVGFDTWCDLLTQIPSPERRCEDLGFINFIQDNNVYAGNFHSEFVMAQFGAWACWICWVALSVMAMIKVYRYHRQEAILTSMNRERQRLLEKVGHREPVVM